MFKLLLFGFAFYLVYLIFFKKTAIAPDKKNSDKPDLTGANELIACAHCETYTTVDEMIIVNGRYYCSKTCAKDAE